MSNPFISICIPTYNRSRIVYQCVCDCLKIPHDWIQVVVTDNCSTDDTCSVLSTIDDPRFKYYRNKNNIGYLNFMKCMTNGDGSFVILLSDEDFFVNTDWERLKLELEKQEDSIFQFNYFDENGGLLVTPPTKLMPLNNIDTLKRIYERFSYAGGFILRKTALVECWNSAHYDKIAYLWSIYNETIIPLECARKSNLVPLDSINAQRSKRNNKGTLDTSAWCGGTSEPYWTIKSRIRQMKEWIYFFSIFDTTDYNKKEMANLVLYDSINALRRYYSIIYGDISQPLFKKYRMLIERDKNEYSNRWIISSLKIYGMIKQEYRKYFRYNIKDMCADIKWMYKVIIWFLKKKEY